MGKRKIINDAVHGFISIPNDFLYELLQHRFMQRLNRIKQLGVSAMVYPSATHTRFQHSLGAMLRKLSRSYGSKGTISQTTKKRQ